MHTFSLCVCVCVCGGGGGCIIELSCHLLELNNVSDRKMSTEHWWNDTDNGKPKYSDKNLSQHFAQHKSCIGTWNGMKSSTLRGQCLTTWTTAWPSLTEVNVSFSAQRSEDWTQTLPNVSPVSHSKTTSLNSSDHNVKWYIKNSPLVPHQLSICSQVRKPPVRCTVAQTPRHQDSALDATSVQAGCGNGPSLRAARGLLTILHAVKKLSK